MACCFIAERKSSILVFEEYCALLCNLLRSGIAAVYVDGVNVLGAVEYAEAEHDGECFLDTRINILFAEPSLLKG